MVVLMMTTFEHLEELLLFMSICFLFMIDLLDSIGSATQQQFLLNLASLCRCLLEFHPRLLLL